MILQTLSLLYERLPLVKLLANRLIFGGERARKLPLVPLIYTKLTVSMTGPQNGGRGQAEIAAKNLVRI